jgi:hypothetical protein
MVSSVMSALILLLFLSVALHESCTRKALLGHDKITLKFISYFLLVLKITQLQNNANYCLIEVVTKAGLTVT